MAALPRDLVDAAQRRSAPRAPGPTPPLSRPRGTRGPTKLGRAPRRPSTTAAAPSWPGTRKRPWSTGSCPPPTAPARLSPCRSAGSAPVSSRTRITSAGPAPARTGRGAAGACRSPGPAGRSPSNAPGGWPEDAPRPPGGHPRQLLQWPDRPGHEAGQLVVPVQDSGHSHRLPPVARRSATSRTPISPEASWPHWRSRAHGCERDVQARQFLTRWTLPLLTVTRR